MTPPRTIIGEILATPWFGDPLRRRLTFLVAAIVLAILCVYPEIYAAEAQLEPQTPGGGLSTILAQESNGSILDLGALTGAKTSVESDLTIARSHAVLDGVISRLNLVGKPGFRSLSQAESKLGHKINIIAIRGSILQITAHDRDPNFAKQLVDATATSVQDRLAEISLRQTAQKRAVDLNRLADANIRLAKAQAALNQFRIANKLPAPEAQLSAGVGLLASLQGELQAKQVELGSLQQFATDQNLSVRRVQAQIIGLENQISEAKRTEQGSGPANLSTLAVINVRYADLYRDEIVAQTLYRVYTRYLDELTIDEMSAHENMNLIEPAYIDPNRQFNIPAVGLLILVLLVAATLEIYLLRPPVGAR